MFFDAADGLVLITNQYQPNTSLLGGAVTVRTIRTDNVLAGFLGNSGSVIIDSRSDIRVTNAIVSSSSSEAGDITLLANEAISLSNGAFLDASTLGEGNGGNISLQAKGDISLSGLGTNLTSNVTQSSTGQGGNINIRAGSLSLSNGVFLDASTFGRGDAGNISIQVNDAFSFSGSAIFSDVGTEEVQATGQGGNISIEARSLSSNDTQISASTFGQGSAGSISIKTDDFVILESGSLIFNTIESNAIGDGGGIRIETRSLLLTEGSQIGTSVLGQGNAGDIFIQADDTVSLVDDAQLFAPDDVTLILSRVQPGGVGTSGDITINTGSLSLSGAQISASLQGEGQAGRITIQAQESVSLVDESTIFSSVDSGASGNGGEIKIRSDSLSIQDGSQLLTIVRGASRLNPLPGRGNAGNINLDVRDLITVSGDC